MISFSKKTALTTVLICSFCIKTWAQLIILDKNGIEEIKNGNTYVITDVTNPSNEDAFLKVFQKYWTITKSVQYIKKSDIKNIAKPGDSFFSFQSISQSSGTFGQSYNTHTSVSNFLYLWVPDKSYFKKDREPRLSDMDGIARIELSGDITVIMQTFKRSSRDTTAIGGYFFNWSPGMLKTYLKQITTALQAHKKVGYGDEITNKEQLKLLQTKTLYCNTDDLNKMNAFARPTNGKIDDAENIFENYKFSYKALSDSELDDKILTDSETTYYLLFVRGGSGKLVAVINSQTGEIIYSRHQIMSWNLKSGDLKSLYKEIR
jgi:hypothetical protein